MDEEDNKKIFEVDNREIDLDDELPLLPIRNHVLFPGAVAPFDVGREKSVALVEDLEGQSQPVIVIFAQRDPATDDPGLEDLHTVGVAARVLKALRHSTGNYSLILQGLARVRLERLTQDEPYLKARVSRMEEPRHDDVETEALDSDSSRQHDPTVRPNFGLSSESESTDGILNTLFDSVEYGPASAETGIS